MIKQSSPMKPFEELMQIFDYDRQLPPVMEERAVEKRNHAEVHDISYFSPNDGQIRAYLVRPTGTGYFAGIVFVHPGPGDRSSFLEEAAELANKGAVSLLINAPWAYPDFGEQAMNMTAEDMRNMFVQTAKDIRRSVDLLQSRPEVDVNRIGYVGHSLGALFGGVLSGAEKRIKALVLMAGTGSFTDVAVLNMPGLEGVALEAYRKTMEPIDPVNYVPHASPSALFFQYGLQDNFYSRKKFLDYYEAASEPKSIRWYEADHYRLNERGGSDRIEWLTKQLGLQI
jgi:cephalosporin-C deacetylase-like acetyl esterase